MGSCGGMRSVWYFHVYHAWLGVTSQFLVRTWFSFIDLHADTFVPKLQLLMLNVCSAGAVLSFLMSAAALQFSPHAHLSVLDFGAPRA